MSGILYGKHDIIVLDATVDMMAKDVCLNKIKEMDIDTLIFLTGVASWKEDSEFVKKIKEIKKDLDVIGIGGFFLAMGTKIMNENQFLNAILMDFTSNNILTYLEGPTGKIDNIIYRRNNEITNGGIVPPSGITFAYPIPRHEMFPITRYKLPIIKKHPFTNILFSLGCVNKCKFCPYGEGSKIPYTFRDVENTIEEMKYIKSLGINEIRFMDYSISINKPNLKKLCERMIEEKFNFTWHALSKVTEVDEESLSLMKKSGCKTLLFGVENGDQRILDMYAKGITLERIKYIFGVCKKLKIDTLAHFIIALPGEDEASVNKTIDFSIELDPDYANFSVAAPYVGTAMRKEAIEKGWIDKRFENDIFSDAAQYPIMETEKLTKEQVWKLKNKAVRKFFFRPSYILKRFIRIRSLDDFIVQAKVGISLIQNMKKAVFK
ncbi:radical SAM protein [Candidatus Woesearchaeota archaeon]|nr:radical SAM protein [Candidatus Woesearchaeota archaeon]